MYKKGNIGAILFMIASLGAFAIFLLVVGTIVPQINDKVEEGLTSQTNVSEVVLAPLEKSTDITGSVLSSLWYIMFGGLLIGLIITGFLMPSNPIFIPVFVIMLITTIIVAMAMSNAYEQIHNTPGFQVATEEQKSVGFVMEKLPLIALIIGLIVLFVTYAKTRGEGFDIMGAGGSPV